MTALFSLLGMLLWGLLLGLCYQFFLRLTEKKSSGLLAAILLYTVCGVLCFLTTALFLYAINGGEWGLYGFLCMVLGFFLYRRKLWAKGEKAVAFIGNIGSRLTGGIAHFSGKAADVAVFPFGRVVDKGEKFVETAEKRWEERKKEKTDAEDQ